MTYNIKKEMKKIEKERRFCTYFRRFTKVKFLIIHSKYCSVYDRLKFSG